MALAASKLQFLVASFHACSVQQIQTHRLRIQNLDAVREQHTSRRIAAVTSLNVLLVRQGRLRPDVRRRNGPIGEPAFLLFEIISQLTPRRWLDGLWLGVGGFKNGTQIGRQRDGCPDHATA